MKFDFNTNIINKEHKDMLMSFVSYPDVSIYNLDDAYHIMGMISKLSQMLGFSQGSYVDLWKLLNDEDYDEDEEESLECEDDEYCYPLDVETGEILFKKMLKKAYDYETDGNVRRSNLMFLHAIVIKHHLNIEKGLY